MKAPTPMYLRTSICPWLSRWRKFFQSGLQALNIIGCLTIMPTALKALTNAEHLSIFKQNISSLSIRSFALPAPKAMTKYSFTPAYRTIDYLNKLLEDWYGRGTVPVSPWAGPYAMDRYKGSLTTYKTIIDAAMAREEQYKHTHYAFYHAFYSSVRLIQDIATQLCFMAKKCPKSDSFVKIREFDDSYKNLSPLQNWMDSKAHYLPEKATSFNNHPDVQPYLLAVNFSLFANLARWDSNTWQWFVFDRSSNPPSLYIIIPSILRSYLKNQSLIKDFSDRLQNLLKYLRGGDISGGGLMQIFIRKERVNDLVYLSKAQGYYWNRNLATLPGARGVSQDITKDWNGTKKRYTSIRPILSEYANNPQGLNIEFNDSEPGKLVPGVKNIVIDRIEGRIFLKAEYFAQPHPDIAMYRYFTLSPAEEALYQTELASILKEIIDKM